MPESCKDSGIFLVHSYLSTRICCVRKPLGERLKSELPIRGQFQRTGDSKRLASLWPVPIEDSIRQRRRKSIGLRPLSNRHASLLKRCNNFFSAL